jgi:hypothetical protein
MLLHFKKLHLHQDLDSAKSPDPDPRHYQRWYLPYQEPEFFLFVDWPCKSLLQFVKFVSYVEAIKIHIFMYTNQGCGSAFISSGSRALMTKKKNTAENFFIFFLSKTTIYLSLSHHKERPSYRRSLQLSKEAIQHFKT